jgi:hypothetical protein
MKNDSWPMILKFDVDSKQLFLITFCRIYHIKGTLQKNRFFENFQGIPDFSKLKLC